MKKITLFAFAVAALSLASCKKDRTCTCTSTTTTTATNSGSNTNTSNNGTTSDSDSDVTTIKKSSKGVARPNCLSAKGTNTFKSAEGTSFEMTYTSTTESTCTLK